MMTSVRGQVFLPCMPSFSGIRRRGGGPPADGLQTPHQSHCDSQSEMENHSIGQTPPHTTLRQETPQQSQCDSQSEMENLSIGQTPPQKKLRQRSLTSLGFSPVSPGKPVPSPQKPQSPYKGGLLQDQRTQQEYQRQIAKMAARQQVLQDAMDGKSQRLIDPAAKGQGYSGTRKTGRPAGRTYYIKQDPVTGKDLVNPETGKPVLLRHKEPGAAVLRRDKSAQARLYIIRQIELACAQEDCLLRDLSPATKASLQRRFAETWRFLQTIVYRKPAYLEFVQRQKVGIHGLRPFGSGAATSTRGSQSQGARLRIIEDPSAPTAQQPLRGVFFQVKKWFDHQRLYGHEVRPSHLRTRLRLTLEAERDRQIVLADQFSPNHYPKVQAAVNQHLARMDNPEWVSKRQSQWEGRTFWPAIGCYARAASKKSHEDQKFDKAKARLTWASIDRAVWLASKGSFDQLNKFVADPEQFQNQLEETVVVQYDHTPVYAKARGEEKTCQNEAERQQRRNHQAHRRLRRKMPDLAQALEDDPASKAAQHLHQNTIQGGDKYRLTLITFASIRNWFRPDQSPVGEFPQFILVVPSKVHCRLEDIDPVSGNWTRTVTQASNELANFSAGGWEGRCLLTGGVH